jgi:protein-disulfide isomerase
MTPDSIANSPEELAVPVNEKDHVQGSRSAPVTLVEYGDYECPDCLNAWPIVQEIRQKLGDRLAFVFRHFPLNSIHPRASAAAQAAEAAGLQGRFWEMHDQLFGHQKELGNVDLTHLALTMGLEIYRFESALELQSSLQKISDDMDGGIRSGVKGTPTFFINGRRYRGKVDAASLLREIELAAQGALALSRSGASAPSV